MRFPKEIVVAFLFSGAGLWAEPVPERLSWNLTPQIKAGYRNAPWIRDPFFPDMTKFRVTGIISGELAFVNNKWVRAGDTMDGYLVKRVTREGVVLTKRAEVVRLKLHD